MKAALPIEVAYPQLQVQGLNEDSPANAAKPGGSSMGLTLSMRGLPSSAGVFKGQLLIGGAYHVL
ncbi:MAG: hypothetical protein LBU32_03980 [Clostridiales bacterium]|nr:hypothetical protein [Clostridiales bacterium]